MEPSINKHTLHIYNIHQIMVRSKVFMNLWRGGGGLKDYLH